MTSTGHPEGENSNGITGQSQTPDAERDLKRVQTLALARMTMVEVATLIGRPLTPQEVYEYRRTRAVAKLRAKAKKDAGPKTTNERVAEHRLRHKMIALRECESPSRRASLEKSPRRWLRYYLRNTFTRPFSRAHDEIIAGAVNAQERRSRFLVAAERGIGKSTLLWGLILMFALTGKERFPVCIMWSAPAVARALRFWRNALAFNERIIADYPEFCLPFSWAKGAGGRIAGTLWEHSQKPTGALLNLSESMIILPDNKGAIGCETINGNPRGLNHPCPDGTVLRPTLVLIDDPQSRGVAQSPVQVSQTIMVIDGDIAGLGEAGKMLPMLMSGNCIAPDDVMDHYMHTETWHCVKVPRVVKWPENFQDPTSATRRHWEEWNRIRLVETKARHGGALAYYRAHKADMVQGMEVSNLQGFERGKGQPDAFYGTMVAYYTMGHPAFMAELQQDPVQLTATTYELRPELILRRKSGFARLHAPAGSVVTAGVDINYVGFNWVVLASDPVTQARRIVAHGIWPRVGGLIPKGSTDAKACALIRAGISRLEAEVFSGLRVNCGGSSVRIASCGWDASNGKWQDAIAAALRNLTSPIKHLPLKAFGSKTYRPSRHDLRQGIGWHVSQFPRVGHVFVLHSDMWRENMQRGFLAEPTEAGALSLYDPDDGENRDFAIQVCAERLIEKVVTDKGEYYSWTRIPGVPNDRPDAAVYACAMAAYEGIGEEKTASRRRKTYKQADLQRR